MLPIAGSSSTARMCNGSDVGIGFGAVLPPVAEPGSASAKVSRKVVPRPGAELTPDLSSVLCNHSEHLRKPQSRTAIALGGKERLKNAGLELRRHACAGSRSLKRRPCDRRTSPEENTAPMRHGVYRVQRQICDRLTDGRGSSVNEQARVGFALMHIWTFFLTDATSEHTAGR